jgi:hypothetical protein
MAAGGTSMPEFYDHGTCRYQLAAQPYLAAIARGIRDEVASRAFLLEGTEYAQAYLGAQPPWRDQWNTRDPTDSLKCPFWSNYWYEPCRSCDCRIDSSVSMEMRSAARPACPSTQVIERMSGPTRITAIRHHRPGPTLSAPTRWRRPAASKPRSPAPARFELDGCRPAARARFRPRPSCPRPRSSALALTAASTPPHIPPAVPAPRNWHPNWHRTRCHHQGLSRTP